MCCNFLAHLRLVWSLFLFDKKIILKLLHYVLLYVYCIGIKSEASECLLLFNLHAIRKLLAAGHVILEGVSIASTRTRGQLPILKSQNFVMLSECLVIWRSRLLTRYVNAAWPLFRWLEDAITQFVCALGATPSANGRKWVGKRNYYWFE